MFVNKTSITCNIYESYLEADPKLIEFVHKLNYKKEQMLTSFDPFNLKSDQEFKNLFLSLYKDWVVILLRKNLNKEFKELQLLSIWCQKYEEGSTHGIHIHHENTNYISFLWYIDCSEKSGNISFRNPLKSEFGLMGIEKNITITPEMGLLILFPSWLEHSVFENKSNKNRISVSFNINKK